jgi:hypothetical protein
MPDRSSSPVGCRHSPIRNVCPWPEQFVGLGETILPQSVRLSNLESKSKFLTVAIHVHRFMHAAVNRFRMSKAIRESGDRSRHGTSRWSRV